MGKMSAWHVWLIRLHILSSFQFQVAFVCTTSGRVREQQKAVSDEMYRSLCLSVSINASRRLNPLDGTKSGHSFSWLDLWDTDTRNSGLSVWRPTAGWVLTGSEHGSAPLPEHQMSVLCGNVLLAQWLWYTCLFGAISLERKPLLGKKREMLSFRWYLVVSATHNSFPCENIR